MNPRFLLLIALPVSSFAGVVRMPALETAPRLSAPAVSANLAVPAFAAPALLAPSLFAPSVAFSPAISAAVPAIQPIAAAVPALAAAHAAAAAMSDPKVPAAEAKAEMDRAFDASAAPKDLSEAVYGAFTPEAVLSAPSAGDDATRPQAVPAPKEPAPAESAAAYQRRYRIARLFMRPLVRLFYKAAISGLENLPAGPAVLTPNHISYVDAFLISFAADRPMRFMMKRDYFDKAPRLLAALGAIPVSGKGGPKAIEAALDAARDAVRAGQTVVIFPEGQLTLTGGMTAFKRGFETIVAQAPAPVIPVYLDGMWGSVFSMQEGPSVWSRLKELPRPVSVRFGPALVSPTAQTARLAVAELGAASMEARVRSRRLPLVREFFKTAQTYWKRPAIADSLGADLTYGKALTGALLLGRVLDAELPDQTNVGVLLPPSAGGALANLALSSVGRIPANLNYTASAEDFAHSLMSADIKTIVTSRKFLEALKKDRGFEPPASRKIILLEDLAPKMPEWKKKAMYILLKVLPASWTEKFFFGKAATSLDDTATILFTSGSSSLPKGVVLTHLNVLSDIEMVREVLPWAKRDAVLGVLPFFHSFGYTITLWMPLVSGMSAAYHANPLQSGVIAKLAAKARATILLVTPDFLQLYTKKIPVSAFKDLRLVIVGAEKMLEKFAAAFEEKFGIRPYEGYGATELSPVATTGVPDAGPQMGSKPGSAGRALPGGVIKAVDLETGALLPEGKEGMLMFKGPNTMKEYLGEPEKTALVLKNGWYVTGDVGYVDRDGFVFITGRLSRFSKIGDMVSHVAVEEKLHLAAGLTERTFVVTGVKDANGRDRLIVLHAGWDGDVVALIAKMRELGVLNNWIPERSAFFKIDAIPQLGTGKLDLKAVNELAAKFTGS